MDKVIDAFPFFNELDILELRLHELAPVVDYFVIVESLQMHGSTRTKSAVLKENWDVVKPFDHKIRYVLLDELLPEYTDTASGWARENYQRNALMPHVRSIAGPQDVVILSDCDEIPRADVVRKYVAQPGALSVLNLDFFYYNVNSYVSPWTRSTIGTLSAYDAEGGLQSVRDRTNNSNNFRVIPDAGWHLSYFGDIERLRLKISNFAHSTDTPIKEMLSRDDKQVAADIAGNKDIYHRSGMLQFSKRSSTDPRLPAYFLSNPKRFEKFTEEFFKSQNAELLK